MSELKQVGFINKNSQGERVYSPKGNSAQLTAQGGGWGAKTGLYMIDDPSRKDGIVDKNMSPTLRSECHGNLPCVCVPEATKQGYAVAEEGDSINLSVPNSKTRRGRVGKGVAQTLDTQTQQFTLKGKRIRRLTPTECERLQGFPDGWTEGIAETQRYKCLGNAVTVDVVVEIANSLTRRKA